jgi:hypothetical protein
LGATYAIPIIYVPVLMITHVVAHFLLLRPQPKAIRARARRCGGILESPACVQKPGAGLFDFCMGPGLELTKHKRLV